MAKLKLDISGNTEVKIPRFLQGDYSVSKRPHVPVDDIEGDGTALNTVRYRPLHKYRMYKKVQSRCNQMEELRDFANGKGDKVITQSKLQAIFKDSEEHLGCLGETGSNV